MKYVMLCILSVCLGCGNNDSGPGDGNVSTSSNAVPLGLAGNFTILSKAGVDIIPTSMVTGDIGVSPDDSTSLTGFSLVLDSDTQAATSDQVVGKLYAPDFSPPTPADLTTAVSDMESAYTDAAGRAADVTELGAGNIGGLTLAAGVYKWGTDLYIPTSIVLNGSASDVWIFQVAGAVTFASAVDVVLAGGAVAQNVFWQSFGQFRVGTTTNVNGVVLCQTAIVLETGAAVTGRLLSQTAVTLDSNIVNHP
jgi:hypothetical protein